MKARIWGGFVFLTLAWGASFLWIKIAVEDVGPYVLVAIRMVFGLAGLIGIVLVQKPSLPRERRIWWVLALLGLTNSSLPWLLIAWAEQTIDSALATVLNSTVPLFTIFFAYFLLRDDRMNVRRVLGLLVGFTGVLLLAKPGAPTAITGRAFAGHGAMLLASLLYAFSVVYARRMLRNVAPLVQAFYSMLIGTALVWMALPLLNIPLVMPSRAVVWIGLVWLGVLSAGVASYILYFLLHAVGPTRTSMVTYMTPVVGVTLGVVVLDELLDFYLVAGMVLIVLGVWVVSRK